MDQILADNLPAQFGVWPKLKKWFWSTSNALVSAAKCVATTSPWWLLTLRLSQATTGTTHKSATE